MLEQWIFQWRIGFSYRFNSPYHSSVPTVYFDFNKVLKATSLSLSFSIKKYSKTLNFLVIEVSVHAFQFFITLLTNTQ